MSSGTTLELTPEGYLHMERGAAFRSEYVRGETFAMAGSNRNHHRIAGNIFNYLSSVLKNTPCEVFIHDMRVSPTNDNYYYPDVFVACEKIQYLDSMQDTILIPVIIFEVLSKSTEDYDRGGKFTDYRKASSLKDYVLVNQFGVLVEHHARQADNRWLMTEYKSLSDEVKLSALPISIPLSVIYESIKWENAD
ncbi:MAG: Uma2 family endonuclease [Planctomycetia bacterium]|nr:Uma2 family endonuclease [Planctomycetia bacterium]